MGMTYAEITLKNFGDTYKVKDGFISEQEVRQATVTALVDTGAATLVINEALRRELGLEIEQGYEATLADGSKQDYGLTDGVQIQWKNRKSICNAVVVPGADEVLLGAVPLEAMDLIVNPSGQELVGAHGDEMLFKLK